MFTFLKILLALACGLALGWFMLVGLCSIPGITYSVACGHNAFIWLPMLIPIGMAISWYMLSQIQRRFCSNKATPAHRNSNSA